MKFHNVFVDGVRGWDATYCGGKLQILGRFALFSDGIEGVVELLAYLADKVSICSRWSGLGYGNSFSFNSVLSYGLFPISIKRNRNRLKSFGSIPVSGNNWLSSLGEHTDIIETCRLVFTHLIL